MLDSLDFFLIPFMGQISYIRKPHSKVTGKGPWPSYGGICGPKRLLLHSRLKIDC